MVEKHAHNSSIKEHMLKLKEQLREYIKTQ